jgi:mono/diheme cytochrome c family protein
MRRLALLSLATLLAGCSTPVPVHFGTHQLRAPVIAISNPSLSDGDPVAGRQAFIALQCVDCHRVAEDRELPLGARAIAGPMLSRMDRHSPKELATRITSRSTGASEELFDRTMRDYTNPMTARQLVDVIAYLRNPRLPAS